MKSSLGKFGVTLVIGLAIFWYAEALSFEVDGFKSGMTKEEVKDALNKMNIDKVTDKGDETIWAEWASDIPLKGNYRIYTFRFDKGKLSQLQIHFPPSMKNFIFLFDKFTTLYGKPVDSYTKISLEINGETRSISFLWGTKSERIDLSYTILNSNDDLSAFYYMK